MGSGNGCSVADLRLPKPFSKSCRDRFTWLGTRNSGALSSVSGTGMCLNVCAGGGGGNGLLHKKWPKNLLQKMSVSIHAKIGAANRGAV